MRTIERRPLFLLLILAALGAASPAQAQEPRGDGFVAGEPLDLMENTRVFGSFHFAESCSYDAERDLYVAPNAGSRPRARTTTATCRSSIPTAPSTP